LYKTVSFKQFFEKKFDNFYIKNTRIIPSLQTLQSLFKMMCDRNIFPLPFFRKNNAPADEVVHDSIYGTSDSLPIGSEDANLATGPTFDAEKLKKKMDELREDDPSFFPYVHVHAGVDISPFVKARYVVCQNYVRTYGNTLQGWLYNDTEESFKHSCEVIARKFGAKPELVEAAMWLKEAYYMDGEANGMDTYSFEEARELYGIRDLKTARFMRLTYDKWYHSDIAHLAQLLDA
jgi:hypothetical protein